MYCIAFNILYHLLYTLYNNELNSNVLVNTLYTVMCFVFIDKDFEGSLPNTQLTDGMMTAQSLSCHGKTNVLFTYYNYFILPKY